MKAETFYLISEPPLLRNFYGIGRPYSVAGLELEDSGENAAP